MARSPTVDPLFLGQPCHRQDTDLLARGEAPLAEWELVDVDGACVLRKLLRRAAKLQKACSGVLTVMCDGVSNAEQSLVAVGALKPRVGTEVEAVKRGHERGSARLSSKEEVSCRLSHLRVQHVVLAALEELGRTIPGDRIERWRVCNVGRPLLESVCANLLVLETAVSSRPGVNSDFVPAVEQRRKLPEDERCRDPRESVYQHGDSHHGDDNGWRCES